MHHRSPLPLTVDAAVTALTLMMTVIAVPHADTSTDGGTSIVDGIQGIVMSLVAAATDATSISTDAAERVPWSPLQGRSSS